jgi:transcriptional regulator with XRE-family HTH domain
MGSFRQNLREELDFQGLTVKELSAKSGIAQGALNMYLGSRESMPPADAAVKIARALGVSVEYLVTGKDVWSEKTVLLQPRDIRAVVQAAEHLDEKNRRLVLENAVQLAKMLSSSM